MPATNPSRTAPARLAPVLVLALSFLLQACFEPDGSSDSTGAASLTEMEGSWLEVRVITELTAHGNTVRDTATGDTAGNGRRYLVIEDTTFLQVFYSAPLRRADTTELEVVRLPRRRWLLEGDTVAFIRSGNTLAIERSYVEDGVSYTTWVEHVRASGAVPPASWVPAPIDTTGSGAVHGTWMALASYSEVIYMGQAYRDTTRYDTADVYARNLMRLRPDSIFSRSFGDSTIVSIQRLSATRWLDYETGDTITTERSGGRLILTISGYDAEYDEQYSLRVELVPYAGAFPPAEWASLPQEVEPNNTAAQAKPIAVTSARLAGGLTLGDADWYSFTAQAGKTYRIRTYGNTDTYLRLYAQNTTTLLTQNDDGSDLNAEIVWTATSSGTLYFTVRGYDDLEDGAYSLNVEEIEVVVFLPKAAASFPTREPKVRRLF